MSQIGLLGCARIIVEQMANVRASERVAILTDYNYSSKELTNLIFENALACGAESMMVLTTPPTGTFISGDIPQIAKAAADAADVVFACTSTSFPLPVRSKLIEKGKKFMLMHHLRDETVLRTVPINLDLLKKRVQKLVEILPETEEAHMTSPEGSDITFSLKDCKFGLIYDGICHPGEFDAVPCGVIDTLPVPGTGNGVIVIDGSLGRYGIVRTPIRITVKDGKFTKIDGGPEAMWLDKRMKKALAAGDNNANHWAEFLIGLNPKAQITCYRGSLLEDERHLGGINIGWGRDTHLGGTFAGEFHGDGMVTNVTITLDDVTIVKNGSPTEELFG